MNTALIFAGGTGIRMNARAKPKQFLELHGKPVIIYTLEHFELHPEIDDITVVCLESRIPELKHLLKRYGIEKVGRIVPGGNEGHDSIYNGLCALNDACGADDIVLIHDGVRPLINEDLISANIAKAKACGAAITAEAVTESVVRLDGDGRIAEVPPRWEMHTAKAPQSFKYGLIRDLYERARRDGVGTVDSAHLCGVYGVEMHTVESPPNNMKITAPTDYYIFRALYEAMENEQIFGIR
ncbi:MAG: 2-C-methyl-D-erythritol 4-phosphate cytidylyltransferase [Clostridiales Family XIII bacterium]|jgi:2-C-methyl-D-erythritol 4-phosphate cytidylyltransferase|nr:2-C-methyl-D-erythritol 4-phosphate cytidylyltransferase [Clostridiales Family XIII bacterium]